MIKDRDDAKASEQATKYIKEQLSANAPDDEAVKKAVAAESTTLDSSDAQYVVLRIARYMQDEEKQIAPSPEETNLEHLYPQNPEENEWGGHQNQDKLEPLTWHLGNLTIFGRRANRKNANQEYHLKRPRFAASKLVMAQNIAKHYDHWDEQTITQRAGKLADLVVKVWSFDNTSRV